jgi:hypothetical protein
MLSIVLHHASVLLGVFPLMSSARPADVLAEWDGGAAIAVCINRTRVGIVGANAQRKVQIRHHVQEHLEEELVLEKCRYRRHTARHTASS